MTDHVYILLTDTGSWLSRGIKSYTQTPYNHASISLDPNLENLFSFGRKIVHNPIYGGFTREDVVTGVYSKFPNTSCLLLELEVTRRQKQKISRILRYFEKYHHHYSYNFIGLFGVMVNKPIEIPSKYFCSQFVSEVLMRAGIELWEKSHALVTPDDFRSISKVSPIFEGRLYDYEPVKRKWALSEPFLQQRSMQEEKRFPLEGSLRAKFYRVQYRYLNR